MTTKDDQDRSWRERPALPALDERQNAMLAEMGVNLWWRESVDTALAVAAMPPSAPAVQVTAPTARPAAQVPVAPARAAAPAPRPMEPVTVTPLTSPATAGDLQSLETCIRECRACDLGQRRQQAVPGMGDTRPDWLIVGEAPGEEEDRQGLPFVGRAGQLLDRMLAAMGLSREQKVYITNVIKCRPPHNRNPDPVEVAHCLPYLLRQVELLQPRIVLAMGRFAAQALLAQGGTFSQQDLRQMPLGKWRGQVHRIEVGGRSLPLVVTYHPAFLLRSPSEKAKAWADLCLALETYVQLPARA